MCNGDIKRNSDGFLNKTPLILLNKLTQVAWVLAVLPYTPLTP